MRLIAGIETPAVIERIIAHLKHLAPEAEGAEPAHRSRAPPVLDL